MLSERPDFEIGKAGLWPFAVLSATFLIIFRGWLFIYAVTLPLLWLAYGNGWYVLVLTAVAMVLAGIQQCFDIRWGDVRRWLSGVVNPKRRLAYRLPPRWPRW